MNRALATVLWVETQTAVRLQVWQRDFLLRVLLGSPIVIRRSRRGGWAPLNAAIVAVADREDAP